MKDTKVIFYIILTIPHKGNFFTLYHKCLNVLRQNDTKISCRQTVVQCRVTWLDTVYKLVKELQTTVNVQHRELLNDKNATDINYKIIWVYLFNLACLAPSLLISRSDFV